MCLLGLQMHVFGVLTSEVSFSTCMSGDAISGVCEIFGKSDFVTTCYVSITMST